VVASEEKQMKVMRAGPKRPPRLMRSLSHGAAAQGALRVAGRPERAPATWWHLRPQPVGAVAAFGAPAGDGLVAPREAQTIHYRIADPKVLKIVRLLYEIYCGK